MLLLVFTSAAGGVAASVADAVVAAAAADGVVDAQFCCYAEWQRSCWRA